MLRGTWWKVLVKQPACLTKPWHKWHHQNFHFFLCEESTLHVEQELKFSGLWDVLLWLSKKYLSSGTKNPAACIIFAHHCITLIVLSLSSNNIELSTLHSKGRRAYHINLHGISSDLMLQQFHENLISEDHLSVADRSGGTISVNLSLYKTTTKVWTPLYYIELSILMCSSRIIVIFRL